MSALSFRPQYAPLIIAGTKTQTIRIPRKRPIKVGETLHLFTGMRTKACAKIGTAVCSSMYRIFIDQRGLMFRGGPSGLLFCCVEADELAQRDGFDYAEDLTRALGSMHKLPSEFDVIEWRDFQPAQVRP